MDYQELMRLNEAYKASRILHTGVRLGIFEALQRGLAEPGEIASSLELDDRATRILLDALAALELVRKTAGRYANSAAAEKYLVSASPVNYGPFIAHVASGWERWGALDEVVRSGDPFPQHPAYQEDPLQTERFILAMHGIATAGGYPEMVADALCLDGVTTLLDVGGGAGSYALEFCRRNPGLTVDILDLPGTLAVTRKIIDRYPEVADRIRLVAADFLTDDIPGCYDLVFLSNIVHSYAADDNQSLVAKLGSNVRSGGRIVVKDHIMSEDGTAPVFGALFSVQMLIHTQGRNYRYAEIEGWLQRAGFRALSRQPLPEVMSAAMVVGTKPQAGLNSGQGGGMV